jgi:hypothetical protein
MEIAVWLCSVDEEVDSRWCWVLVEVVHLLEKIDTLCCTSIAEGSCS